MSLETVKVETIADEFAMEGLKNYLLSELDIESYSDETLDDIYQDFLYVLFLESRKTSSILDGCHVDFAWDVYAGTAKLVDIPAEDNAYLYISEDGTRYNGVDAIIANIVYSVDIDLLLENFWKVKSVNWKFAINTGNAENAEV
jgi:hypothetical protein